MRPAPPAPRTIRTHISLLLVQIGRTSLPLRPAPGILRRAYSVVTLLARLRGMSTSQPRITAIWYDNSCGGGGGGRERGSFAGARSAVASGQRERRSCAHTRVPAAGGQLLSTEGVYSRYMGRGNSREGRGRTREGGRECTVGTWVGATVGRGGGEGGARRGVAC